MATPANINFLSPTGFTLEIEKLPTTTFFAQSAELPSVSLGITFQDTPMLDITIPGDKLTFETFSLDFLIDEDMVNYKEIFAWMVGLGHPESLDQYASFHAQESGRLLGGYNPRNHSSMYSDGTLNILTNNSTQNNNKIYIVDMFPIALSAMRFSTAVNDINYMTARVSFGYSNFKFI